MASARTAAHVRRAVAVALLAIASSGPAVAVPLSEEACNTLEQERAGLITAGANHDLAKGAEWGRANLDQERLSRVQRLIEIDEQLAFRCVQPKTAAAAPAAKASKDAAPAAKPPPLPKKAPNAAGTADQPKPPAPAPAKAAAKKAPAPAPKPPASAPAKTAAPAPKPAEPKAAKPKPSDAYVPPPKQEQLPWAAPQPVQQ
jgi:hypothetical protein